MTLLPTLTHYDNQTELLALDLATSKTSDLSVTARTEMLFMASAADAATGRQQALSLGTMGGGYSSLTVESGRGVSAT